MAGEVFFPIAGDSVVGQRVVEAVSARLMPILKIVQPLRRGIAVLPDCDLPVYFAVPFISRWEADSGDPELQIFNRIPIAQINPQTTVSDLADLLITNFPGIPLVCSKDVAEKLFGICQHRHIEDFFQVIQTAAGFLKVLVLPSEETFFTPTPKIA